MSMFNKNDSLQYLYNNFIKVDGLWFVKLEELLGFEKALEIDKKVWEILPKLQARFIKNRLQDKLLKPGAKTMTKDCIYDSPGSNCKSLKKDFKLLYDSLKLKLNLDNFKFRIIKNKLRINVIIDYCPWHNNMIKSHRENKSYMIGKTICNTEYYTFAREFIKNIDFKITEQICNSDSFCKFNFTTKIDNNKYFQEEQ